MAYKPKKYYAVRVGRVPGIYESWPECESQVHGYPGAQFKSFESRDSAQSYIDNDTTNLKSNPDDCIAYVDGSYDIKNKRYSCGVVLLKSDEIIEEYNEVGSDIEASSMRNVAGEILGSQRAVEMAIALGFKRVVIYHDYSGIAGWGNGEWKTNNQWTTQYKEFIRNSRKKIEIKFVKVKGHSSNKYNDMADQLAKDALGIK